MRLLDRYLLRELLVPLGYCLGGFLIFWISFDLFTEISDFQDLKLHGDDIALYYAVRVPELLVTVLPITFLLALLYALTNHSRHQELTAMRAAGQSLERLALPYLALGFFLSLLLLGLNEYCVPRTAELAQEILHRRVRSKSETLEKQWHSRLDFRNARAGRMWNIGAFNVETYEMRNPQVSWDLPDGARRTLLAAQGTLSNGVWTFFDVQEFFYPAQGEFNPKQVRHQILSVPEFSETPEQIKSEIRISPLLSSIKAAKDLNISIREILDYLRLHPDLNKKDKAWLHTQLQGRLATPWTCLVVVLISLPFGAASGRRNAFVGVASSIFICFAYFILLRLGLALGPSGVVPPVVAAWFPNVLFAGLGIWLTRRAH